MPRVSKRAKALSCLSSIMDFRLHAKAIRMFDDDDDSLEDMKDLATAICISEIRNRRYLEQPTKYRKSPAVERFNTDLNAQQVEGDNSSSSSEMP